MEKLTKNLSVTHYRNGDEIPQVTDPTEWASLTTGAWCYYDNAPTNEEKYGKLYNWYAIADPRGLAPTGYHVPTDEDMDALKLHENAVYGGTRNLDGSFTNIGNFGHWWSSTENFTSNAWSRNLDYTNSNVYRFYLDKRLGFSVRCVRDVELTDLLETYESGSLEKPNDHNVDTNEMVSSQTTSDKWKEYQDWLNEVPEISDEKIEIEGWKYCYENKISSTNIVHWITACKWYREQLKQKL